MLKDTQKEQTIGLKSAKASAEVKTAKPQTTFEASAQFYLEALGDEEFQKMLDEFHVKTIEGLPESERDSFLVKCGRRLDAINS